MQRCVILLLPAYIHDLADAAPASHRAHTSAQRYLRNAANTSVNAIIDNSFDRARCVKPVIHPQWVPDTALNDLAICFFDGTSRFEPVRLAVGECVAHAEVHACALLSARSAE